LSSKTKDLDEKFGEVLGSMALDTAGALVEILSRQGKLISLWGNHLADLQAFFRVFAIDHRSLEGLCLGLGGEVFHGQWQCVFANPHRISLSISLLGLAVDWVLFSKVFEVLVKLMNTLSRHFTTRLDESAVTSPLPEIRLDGVKSPR
jgi:hypothetical protein